MEMDTRYFREPISTQLLLYKSSSSISPFNINSNSYNIINELFSKYSTHELTDCQAHPHIHY